MWFLVILGENNHILMTSVNKNVQLKCLLTLQINLKVFYITSFIIQTL